MANKSVIVISLLVVLALLGIVGYVLWSGNEQQKALDVQRQSELKSAADKIRQEQEAVEAQKKTMESVAQKADELTDDLLNQAANMIGSTGPTPSVSPSSSAKTTPKTISVSLTDVNSAVVNQSGVATITDLNGKVKVSVSITPIAETSQPIHIHSGTCPGTGAVVYPLKEVVNGKSETELAVSMADLAKKAPLVINVHKSVSESSVYSACGAINFK